MTLKPAKSKLIRWRYWLINSVLLLAMFGLVWRMVYLTVLNRQFLQQQGDARTLRVIDIPTYRGMITDRYGAPLAISTPVDSVWLNPQDFDSHAPGIEMLAQLLAMPVADLDAKAKLNAEREFVYVKRGLDPLLGNQIKALQIPGIGLQREYRRYYPESEATAHLIGFTNIDDHGQEGLELAYDQWLKGTPGRRRVLRDNLGRTVAEINVLRAPKPGHNLALSIDRRIQYLAYSELAAGVQKFQAQSGSVVVLDVKTGEVLAMVNYPSYNPNNRPAGHDSRYRNRAMTDTFEPGSTMKTFSMASALMSGKYQADSTVNTAPGWMIVDGRKIEDEHNNGVIDMATILARSSNVGISKIILSLPLQQLWETFHLMGFGQSTGTGFPGESAGALTQQNINRPFVMATMAFGYSMTATTLQLAQAYSILGHDGIKLPISLLRIDKPPIGQQVLTPAVAHQLLVMLEAVLAKGGTAPLAKVKMYRVAGKTGTARLSSGGGYAKHRYNSSFIGIAPASDPQLLVAVVLHDPQGKQYYGGYTAGPIFAQIMGDALRLLNIAPDDLSTDKPATSVPPINTDDLDG